MCIPPIVARQRLGGHVPAATNIHNNRKTTGRVCGPCIKGKSVGLCIPLSLLDAIRCRHSRSSEELLEASFFYAVLYRRKVNDYFFLELLVLCCFRAGNSLQTRWVWSQMVFTQQFHRFVPSYRDIGGNFALISSLRFIFGLWEIARTQNGHVRIEKDRGYHIHSPDYHFHRLIEALSVHYGLFSSWADRACVIINLQIAHYTGSP
jgi:hypothetical protein